MSVNKPGKAHPWSFHHASKGTPKPPSVKGLTFSVIRKPSFTSVVRDGLLSIAGNYLPRSEDERRAIQWIREAADHAERALVQQKLRDHERRSHG
jgi:hypothetical protein